MDCILGYHLNPMTCGVAKFNYILAEYLSVPVVDMFTPEALAFNRPLLSLKISEFAEGDLEGIDAYLCAIESRQASQSLNVFFHDFSETEIEYRLVNLAENVFCLNDEIVSKLKTTRSDLVAAWCPPMLLGTQRFKHADISVLSFGMAHKVRSDYYGKLHSLLEETGKSYCLYLSTALHENTTFNESFSSAFEDIRDIFGDNVYFLGYLSDTAVYNYLRDTTYFAAFFDEGVRANNSSVSAAMQAGSIVVTNLDANSPTPFAHGINLLDIGQTEELPVDCSEMARISGNAIDTARIYDWDSLINVMRPFTHPTASVKVADL